MEIETDINSFVSHRENFYFFQSKHKKEKASQINKEIKCSTRILASSSESARAEGIL